MDDINENLENRIKNLNIAIANTNNDVIMKEKQEFLDKLIDMYPFLENEKQNIYSKCLTDDVDKKKKHTIKKIDKEEIILEQFKYNNKIYYKDKVGGILDENAELVGFINSIDSNGNHNCTFFNDCSFKNIDINTILG